MCSVFRITKQTMAKLNFATKGQIVKGKGKGKGYQ